MEITLNELISAVSAKPVPEQFPLLNKNIFVRTVSFFYIGYASAVEGGFVVLENAAWIPDTGRWADCLSQGMVDEVEPYPDKAYVRLDSIIDVCVWTHDIPREQK